MGQSLNLAQYVQKRTGVPLGHKHSLRNMLARSLAGGQFTCRVLEALEPNLGIWTRALGFSAASRCRAFSVSHRADFCGKRLPA